MLFLLTVIAILVNELPRKNDYISSYYFYAMNKASESFVSMVVCMLLLSSRKFFLVPLICTTSIKIPVIHVQGLHFLQKKGLGLFHFFRLQLKILQIKTVQNIKKCQALVFQCIKRPLYYSGNDHINDKLH